MKKHPDDVDKSLAQQVPHVDAAVATISSHSHRFTVETQLRSRAEQQAAIASLGRLALESESLSALLEGAAQIVVQTLHVEQVAVFELQADEKTLLLISGLGWPAELIGKATIAIGEESQLGLAIESREPVIIPDITRETYFQPPALLTDAGVVSSAAVAIEASERAFGVLGAYGKTPRVYSTNDRAFLQAVADVLAPAIARLLQERLMHMQNELYESISRDDALRAVLATICRRTEELVGGGLCAIMLFEERTHRLRLGAGPNLEPELAAALDGLEPGRAGEVEQIAQRFGTKACWSTPIFIEPGRIVGTYAIMHRSDSRPTSQQLQVLDTASNLTAHAVRRDRERRTRRKLENNYIQIEKQVSARTAELQRTIDQLTFERGERKRAEDMARGGEERYLDLFDSSSDLIQIVDPDGKLRFVNRAWRQRLGYAEGEVSRLKLEDVLHPECRSRFDEIRKRALAGDGTGNIELKFFTREGKSIVVEGSIDRFYENGRVTGTRAILRDVSEKKRAEEEQQKFVSLVECSSDLIGMATIEGQMFFLNEAGRKLIGIDTQRPLGSLHLSALHPPDTWTTLDRIALPSLREVDRWEGEGRLRHLSKGQLLDVHISLFLVRNAQTGEPMCIAVVERDITHRKEVDRMKDDLVATVSHELRTPLTSLRGYAELLLARQFAPEKQNQFLRIIHDETLRLNKLITDFLDIRRMEAGRQSYEFQRIDIGPLVTDAVNLYRAGGKQFAWQVDLANSLPPVHADRDRIWQVLSNLISNAMKFTDEGKSITVGAKQQGANVVVWVADKGTGIPSEHHAHLFEKFYRATSSDRGNPQGSGLGLAIVKEIVEAHDGRVWVESKVGKGTTFYFSLPAQR